VQARAHSPIEAVTDRRDMMELSTWLALALVRQGRLTEARQVIDPVVKFQRELAVKNHGDQWQTVELAAALYAQSLTGQPPTGNARSAALLHEAAAKMDALPAAMRSMHDVQRLREFIRAAARGG